MHSSTARIPSENEGKIILFWNAKTWTNRIAWMEIILSFMVLMNVVKTYFEEPSETLEDFETNDVSHSISEIFFGTQIRTYSNSTSRSVAPFVLGLIGQVFGGLLLAGEKLRKPKLLLIWLISNAILLGLTLLILIILLCMGISVGLGKAEFWIILIFVLVPFGIQLFSIHVVRIYYNELSNLQKQLNFAVRFHSFQIDGDEDK